MALFAVHQLMYDTLAEDAFITFRYSAHLAGGHGPVFNAGERVEGYSNFLWMVVLAGWQAVVGTNLVGFARLLGVVCAMATLVLLHLLVRRVTGNPAAGVLAAALAAGSGSMAAYGPSGLETPLFALLALAVVYAAYVQRPVLAGLLVALATMTRPDGVILAGVVGVWLIVVHRRDLRVPLLYSVSALALALPWTIWRVAYYGYLLPNALAAKSGLDLRWQLENGWAYLLGFLGVAQALLVFVPLAIWALIVGRYGTDGRTTALAWLLFALATVYIAFFTVTGGDWMPAWRFFAPAVPLLVAGIVVSWSAVADRLTAALTPASRAAAVIAAGVTGVLMATSHTNASMAPLVQQWSVQVHELSEFGAWLGRTLPPGTVISTFANGALSYAAGPQLTVVDQLGLTDEHIARNGKRTPKAPVGHGAHDYDYVFDVRRPDVVVTSGSGFAPSSSCPPRLDDPYVGRTFRFGLVDRWAVVYVRTERAAELTALLDADASFEHEPCQSGSG